MFAEYEYGYDRIIEDTDDLLLNDEDHTESDWENYYHNLAKDIE